MNISFNQKLNIFLTVYDNSSILTLFRAKYAVYLF